MAIAFTDFLVALRASNLPGTTRSAALWVASRCANGWPVTFDLIAADSGFSKSTVQRAINALVASGWLVRFSNKTKGNSYELAIPAGLNSQGDHSEWSERPYGNGQIDHAEGKGMVRVTTPNSQGDHSEWSERPYGNGQIDHTYIRTKQEHKNNKNLSCARGEDAATIKHSNLNEGLLARWVRELVKVPEAKEEILRLKFQKAPGEVYQTMFVTSLYTTEALFERFRPWFVRLQAEGRL